MNRAARGRKLLAWFGAALVYLAAAELAARLFWRVVYGVPVAHPDRILYAYYPELAEVDGARPSRDDPFFDVVLLGPSVLQRAWGTIEQDLHERLSLELGRKVRIFNLAMRAQTSRDTWLKYEALADARFELVVFYHGINDARANNVPPAAFRDDYSHMPWYQLVQALAPSHGRARFALPHTLRWLAARARSPWTSDRSAAPGVPRAEWIEHGREVRSATAFRRNLENVLALAERRGDPVLLMTFATYVPADYSPEAFAESRLDYATHLSPIEIWGRREYVLDAVARHNEIVRQLAGSRRNVLLVDQALLMTGTGRNFNDPCHLTVRGSSEFVEHMLRGLLQSREGR
jgi:hypothetical protein